MVTMNFRKVSDIEIAMFWAKHIEYPCAEGLREVYISEAKKQIPHMKNPYARKFLNHEIEFYEKTTK